MNKLFNKIKDESGQALVIVAVSLVALLGVTAFSVDLGMAYNAKAELQAAADAAALAGAQDLPNAAVAIQSAKNYAGFNDVQVENVSAVSPYAGNSKLIEVTCSRTFDYLFAKVLGFDSKVIVARAVATKEADWVGDALPFINLDDKFVSVPDKYLSTGEAYNMQLWERTSTSGDFEKLWPLPTNKVDQEYVLTEQPDESYTCKLTDMDDGFALSKGVNESDLPEIKAYLTPLIGKSVYVLSLQNSLIGVETTFEAKSPQVETSKIVLLKCTLVGFNFDNLNSKDNEAFGVFLHWDGAISYDLDWVLDPTNGGIPDLNGNGDPYVKLVE
jgi:hypothetical protein